MTGTSFVRIAVALLIFVVAGSVAAQDEVTTLPGVIVQPRSGYEISLATEDRSGGWNGAINFTFAQLTSASITSGLRASRPATRFPIVLHFGADPTLKFETPNIGSRVLHIVWRLSDRNLEVTIPKSQQWRPEDLNSGADDVLEYFQTRLGNDPALPPNALPPALPRLASWTLSGVVSADGGTMKATFGCFDCDHPEKYLQTVTLNRFEGASLPGRPARAVLASDELRIAVDAGPGPLFGTWREPPRAPPGPLVLIVPDAGPVNGDGNSTLSGPGPDNLRLIAEALDKAGYRSLRFDKRGVGESASLVRNQTDVRFADLVEDVANWARYARGRPNVTCVVLLGHGEGALTAMLAAQKVPICGFITLSAAGRPLGAVLREQARRAGWPAALQQRYNTLLSSLEQGRLPSSASTPTEPSLVPVSLRPYLMEQINLDPAALIRVVRAPTLIIQGDNDLQVSVDDARRLAQARPDAQLLIVRSMNNATKVASRTPRDNADRSLEADVPLAPPVMPAVIAFLKTANQ